MTALGFTKKIDFANFLGKDSGTITKYLKNQRNLGGGFILDLKAKIPNLNLAYFESNREPMFVEPNLTLSDTQQNEPEGVSVRLMPIYGRVAAGSAIGMWEYENTPEHQVGISHYRIEPIKEKIYGFTVYGDSMRDRLRPGDEVGAVKLDFDTKKPRDGDIVVIFFNTDPEVTTPTIKLFQWVDKARGDFILKSINPYHNDMVKNKKDVVKIFRVVFNISFVDYKDNRK
jgi:SOS-response transcriptional repressor LexA